MPCLSAATPNLSQIRSVFPKLAQPCVDAGSPQAGLHALVSCPDISTHRASCAFMLEPGSPSFLNRSNVTFLGLDYARLVCVNVFDGIGAVRAHGKSIAKRLSIVRHPGLYV
jgi:hypothetical protein